jgi:hypothetical protein
MSQTKLFSSLEFLAHDSCAHLLHKVQRTMSSTTDSLHKQLYQSSTELSATAFPSKFTRCFDFLVICGFFVFIFFEGFLDFFADFSFFCWFFLSFPLLDSFHFSFVRYRRQYMRLLSPSVSTTACFEID